MLLYISTQGNIDVWCKKISYSSFADVSMLAMIVIENLISHFNHVNRGQEQFI